MLTFREVEQVVEVRREEVRVGLLRTHGCTPRIELETKYLRLDELREIAERLEIEAKRGLR